MNGVNILENLYIPKYQALKPCYVKFEKNMSCCGVICSECEYYPGQCPGCQAVEGKVFWAEYVGRTVCEKYECCVIQKKLAHCGKCGELPCRRYDLDDPNLSPEENKRIREENIKLLRSLK